MSELDRVSAIPAKPKSKSFLIYGPPGSGKTFLMSRHPAKRKLWLDADDKISEMEVLPGKEYIKVWAPKEPLGNPDKIEIPYSPNPSNVKEGQIPAIKPRGYEKIVAVTNELLKLARDVSQPEFPYDLVVLDTLTLTAEHWTRLLMYTHKVSFMTERLWGIYLAGLQEFINGFLQLPCDRAIICHEKRESDETGMVTAIRPSVAGQLGNNLARYFTEAYYLKGRQREGVYKMQTCSDRTTVARTSKALEPEPIADEKVFA